MALQAKYQQFLSHPTTDALAADAAIHYVPTLSTINTPVAILKHLNAQQQQLRKKSEKFLNVVEGISSICVETETILEFIYGGGCYLPGMDDNMLADKVITMVVVHVVSFDADQKVQQVRLFWDSGSLLKSIEVIGRSGRNWPLFDGKDHSRLITGAVDTMPKVASASVKPAGVPRRQSRGGANADPYTSLDNMFEKREIIREDSPRNPVAPRESSKPAPREYGELFAAGGEPTPNRSPSVAKTSNVKVGAGKNFPSNRLFDTEGEMETPKGVKPNPLKYSHFELGEGLTAQPVASRAKNMNAAQWDFADFTTPHKLPVRTQPHMVRHNGDELAVDSPGNNKIVNKAVSLGRPDAATHFEISDETPEANKKVDVNPRAVTRGNSLYQDQISGAENMPLSASESEAPPANVLANITNKNSHSRTFNSHWGNPQTEPLKENVNSKTVPEARKKVASQLETHWDMYDESPQQKATGIKIAGNGMGNRIGASWSLYDESPQQKPQGGINIAGNGMGNRSGSKNPSNWWEYEGTS